MFAGGFRRYVNDGRVVGPRGFVFGNHLAAANISGVVEKFRAVEARWLVQSVQHSVARMKLLK